MCHLCSQSLELNHQQMLIGIYEQGGHTVVYHCQTGLFLPHNSFDISTLGWHRKSWVLISSCPGQQLHYM